MLSKEYMVLKWGLISPRSQVQIPPEPLENQVIARLLEIRNKSSGFFFGDF
jgi:hypothetical protein